MTPIRQDVRVPESLELDATPPDGAPPGTPTRGRGPSMIGVAVVAVLSAGAGAWFGAPRLAPRAAEAVASIQADRSDAGAGEDVESADQYQIANLVLNPADSGGTRFLVASLVLDVTEAAYTQLGARDAEARDVILTRLAARTVEELTRVALRDTIREDLRAGLNQMLGFDGVRRIFLPQFVIQ